MSDVIEVFTDAHHFDMSGTNTEIRKFGNIETAVEYLTHRSGENLNVYIYSNVPTETAAQYLARIQQVCSFKWVHDGRPDKDTIKARVRKILGG